MQKILRQIPAWSAMAFLIYMPLHIFLSQWLSLATGGLSVWKVVKDGVLAAVVLFCICLVWKYRRGSREYNLLAGLTAVYGVLHLLLWAIHPALFRTSAILGIIYNNRLFACLVIGASALLLLRTKHAQRALPGLFKIALGVSTLVALVGVIQYFLPKDTLTHFGYSVARGVRPNFFIDDNPAFPRVMSTLRDPNSLGAYLLLPLAALTVLLCRWRAHTIRQRIIVCVMMLLHLTALYLTFSRSAWLGSAVVIATAIGLQFSSQFVYVLRRWWWVGLMGALLLVSTVFFLRHNPAVDGVLTHSTAAQVGQYDSNEYHWMYLKRGLEGIWHNPWGHGPGTAGLASIQNPDGGLLTENYYVQIGYEVGVIGLVLFTAGNIWVYVHLRRRGDQWAVILMASFWGYVVMNMVLHTWSNEAVAAQWWLLAGAALVAPAVSSRTKK